MTLESPQYKPGDALAPADASASGNNVLDLHLDQRLVLPAATRSNVTDNNGAVGFPNIYNNQRAEANVAAPAPPAPENQDYTVKNGDSLWRIAKNSLTHGDRHMRVDGEQIWQRIKDIVDANCDKHPDIKSNPFFITKGEHLIIPGATLNVVDASRNQPLPAQDRPDHSGHTGGRHRHNHGQNDAQAPLQGRVSNDGDKDNAHPAKGAPVPIESLATALKGEARHQAIAIHTVNECSQGPRQTFEHFGIKIKPMPATMQGAILENSGLFDKLLPGQEPQPGDYGYRHWSAKTIARRGMGDLGDSFIVTDCTRNGMNAANDHLFVVPPGGGYYAKGITFLRPNAKFYAAYKHFQETGEKTHLT